MVGTVCTSSESIMVQEAELTAAEESAKGKRWQRQDV